MQEENFLSFFSFLYLNAERQQFSDAVKESILSKQHHKCAHCRRILHVVDWDWDHKIGDRSNNSESNCQALCPNCHAIKTRRARK
jgi:5-methylcytosine-specific restriction endonuclease McrA